jgi:hypothetical protein
MRRRIRTGLMTVAVVAGLGVAARVAWTDDPAGVLPDELRDLSGAREVDVRSAAGEVVLRATFEAGVAADGETRVALKGSGKGEAEIEIESKAGPVRTELEVDVSGLQPNQVYAIHVDGRRAGELTTDGTGSGELELSAQAGAR